MTATRDPDRLLRAWLDLMPDEAPDRAIAAVLQATETTRQVRALPRIGRWRFPMNRFAIIATAVLVIAALAGGTYLLVGGPNGQAAPTPSAVPPTATPQPEGIVPMPEAVRGDWHAEVDGLPNITAVAQPIRLSLDWQEGREAHIQLDGTGDTTLSSAPLAAAEGELRFRNIASPRCAADDIGRYRWTRSADGLFLTLELLEDECADRALAFARTWVHSLSAVNDGGIGMIPGDQWIQVTMPKMRLAMGGGTDAADIHTFNQGDPFKSLIALNDPMGFGTPCGATRQPISITPTVAGFETYLGTLPGLQLTPSDATVDGISARRFEGVGVTSTDCPANEVGLFRSRVPTEADAEWIFHPGDQFFIWALVRNGHLTVFSYDGDGATLAEAQGIVDTIQFLDQLPTP